MNIIFDFDGTLFDTRTVDVVAFNRALADMGHKTRTESEILATIGKPLLQIGIDLVGEHHARQFESLVLRYELEEIPPRAQMYPFAVKLLHMLKKSGHNLAICSNGSREYLHAILAKFNLLELFDLVWHAHEGYSKDRALPIIMAQLPAGKTVYVGDRLEDREAARSNSLPFIGAAYGFGPDEMNGVHLLARQPEDIPALIKEIQA